MAPFRIPAAESNKAVKSAIHNCNIFHRMKNFITKLSTGFNLLGGGTNSEKIRRGECLPLLLPTTAASDCYIEYLIWIERLQLTGVQGMRDSGGGNVKKLLGFQLCREYPPAKQKNGL